MSRVWAGPRGHHWLIAGYSGACSHCKVNVDVQRNSAAKEQDPQVAPDLVHALWLSRTFLLYPAGTIRSAAGNATLLVVELKQMQRIPEDSSKILTAWSVLMYRIIQNFHWHWCCRYGYKNYNYTDHVLNETFTLPPLQQPHNSSIAS